MVEENGTDITGELCEQDDSSLKTHTDPTDKNYPIEHDTLCILDWKKNPRVRFFARAEK